MYKYILKVLFLVACFSYSVLGQDILSDREIEKLLQNDKVVLNFPDSTINFSVLTESKNVKIDETKFYYWFRAGAVRYNRGGYDGKLLTDAYRSFYQNLNLKSQGKFKNGLKVGTWRSWYVSGERQKVEYWKKGLIHRKAYYYDESGALIYTLKYRNGIAVKKKLSKAEKKIEKEAAKEEKKQKKALREAEKKSKSSGKKKKDSKSASNTTAQQEQLNSSNGSKTKSFWPWDRHKKSREAKKQAKLNSPKIEKPKKKAKKEVKAENIK